MKRYRVTAELGGHVEVMDLMVGPLQMRLLRWLLRKIGARVMVFEVAP